MTQTYLDRIKEVVAVDPFHSDIENDIVKMLDVTKAIIFDGHFRLLCRRHTDIFFRFAAISQYPHYMSLISRAMVKWLKSGVIAPNIDVILSPSSAGMFLAYDIARELNGTMKTRAAYTAIDEEGGYPSTELIEGFEIKEDENVLIVNDMTTTGNGLATLVKASQKAKARVVGICIFGNRGVHEKNVKEISGKFPLHSIVNLNMPSWNPLECRKRCVPGRQLIGSSRLNHLPIYSTEDANERYLKKIAEVA